MSNGTPTAANIPSVEEYAKRYPDWTFLGGNWIQTGNSIYELQANPNGLTSPPYFNRVGITVQRYEGFTEADTAALLSKIAALVTDTEGATDAQ